MTLPWIVAGVFAVAAVLSVWRWLAVSKEADDVRKETDALRAQADEARHALKQAQGEFESKRRDLAELQAERAELKKKLFDAKEDAKRQKGASRSRDDVSESYEARLRDMNHALSEARDEVTAARAARAEADKVLGEVRTLRERVQQLEAERGKRAERPAREPREPREAPPAGDPAAELAAAKRRLADREKDLATLRRRLDNANRIYFITKSQLDLAQDKIAQQGFQFATLLAIHEGREPPKMVEPSPADDRAAERQALAEAMDEREPVLPGG